MHCTQILCHLVVGLAFDKSENPIVMFELVKHCCLLFCIFFLVCVFLCLFPILCDFALYIFNSESGSIHFNSILSFVSFRFACSLTRSYLHQYILNWTLNTKLQYCCHLRISHIHLNRCSFCLLCIRSIDKVRRSSLASINEQSSRSILRVFFFHFSIPAFYNKTDKFLTKIC